MRYNPNFTLVTTKASLEKKNEQEHARTTK